MKPTGDMFARYGVCDKMRQLKDSHPMGSTNYAIFDKVYKMNLVEQEAHWNAYYGTWYMFVSHLNKCVTIIHDKMDHAKIIFPCLASKNKSIDAFMRLPVVVTGMIAHGHGDGKYAHFLLDFNSCDSNYTMGLIAKLLRDLEKPLTSSLRILFENSEATPLFIVVLRRKEVCMSALGTDLVPVPTQKLPPILHV
jgi:F0F1-type ATP synthase membrane subunit a